MLSSEKQTLASTVSGCIDMEPVCVSFLSRRNIVLIWTRPPMYFCILCLFTSIYFLMAIYLKCSKYFSISFLTRFLRLVLMSEPTDGIPCDFTKNPSCCTIVLMMFECWQWMRQVVSYSIWELEPFLSPTLPLSLPSFPIQAVPLRIALTIHAW